MPVTGTLIVFAREPIPGQVKTRLIPALGSQGAAMLYRSLLEGALEASNALSNVRKELWCTGANGTEGICHALARLYGMRYRTQMGEDLGARMAWAFEQAMELGQDHTPAQKTKSSGPAVLIGSDCPGYHGDYLASAFKALGERDPSYDAVLGPAQDGGYVLIGLRRLAPSLFHAIPWGTDAVLASTREALSDLGWRWLELPTLVDLDRPEDLDHFPALATTLRLPTNPE